PESGARGGAESTTCGGRIGVAPIRSALVRGKLWQVVYSSTTLFSCTSVLCRSRSSAQDAPADIGNPCRWSRGGDESRPQSTSCRFYAATLMNAGFPVWTSRGEPAVGP